MTTVIGRKRTNFTAGDTGQVINGVNFYTVYDSTADGLEGQMCERIFVTVDKLSKMAHNPKVGDSIEIIYNRYGKPEDFKLVTAK